MQVTMNHRFATRTPPFDPEAAARDPFYWADHADEDLEATEARRRDEAWAQIKEIHRGS